jgi:hypothetical protein
MRAIRYRRQMRSIMMLITSTSLTESVCLMPDPQGILKNAIKKSKRDENFDLGHFNQNPILDTSL